MTTLPTSLSTLNVNAPVFIPNVNAPEFVPSFMKEETGQTQPAAPGEASEGLEARIWQGVGVVGEVGQVSVAEKSTSWRVTWRTVVTGGEVPYQGQPIMRVVGGGGRCLPSCLKGHRLAVLGLSNSHRECLL